MFTTAQQVADAKINGKIYFLLALIGAIVGAGIGPAIQFQKLPPVARQLVTARYVMSYHLGRLPSPIGGGQWPEIRQRLAHENPEIKATLDGFPAATGYGAAAGFILFPLVVAGAMRPGRQRKKMESEKRGGAVDFIERR